MNPRDFSLRQRLGNPEGLDAAGGGKTVFKMPRVACIRSMVMNHLIHHRAQLTVYYRLLDVPVPGLYGPSGDEQQSAATA